VTRAAAVVLSALAGLAVATLSCRAESAAPAGKPSERDAAAVRACIKAANGDRRQQDACIGIIAAPCAEADDAASTADQVGCAVRELAVWDDLLNESFRRLRDTLDAKQRIKLRDMQRAWMETRDRMCAFYWDVFQGTMAAPMTAFCRNRETARRALFLHDFVANVEDR
jgi:uncharacterized protein YecT (DUF1311 family)